jgi:hypothetical protein
MEKSAEICRTFWHFERAYLGSDKSQWDKYELEIRGSKRLEV